MTRMGGFYGGAGALGKWAIGAFLGAAAAAGAQDASVEARVDALFSEWDRNDSPGCVLGVMEEGRLVYDRGYGMANLEHDIPLSSRSVFRTGSLGKQFAAFAVLLAEKQGKLSVDDDVRKYLPELPVTEAPITIAHLIHHTSGLRDYLTLMALAGARDEDFYSEQDILDKLSLQENLNFPPGSEYLYSNTGYFLLSQIILRATGLTLAEFAEEHLFGPLGMKSSHFHDDFRRIVKGRAQGYRPRDDEAGGGFEIDQTTLNMVGDGGVFTTIEDLVHWDRNFYTGEVGGQELAKRRVTPGRLTDGTRQTYAYGLSIGERGGRRTVSHGGAFVGFRSAMLQYPEERFSVYVLCNLATAAPMGLAEQVADIYLGAEGSSATMGEEAPLDPDAAAWAGVYYDASTRGVAVIAMRDGALYWGERDAPLTAVPGETGVYLHGTSRLAFSPDGLEVTSPGQRSFRYVRVEAVTPDVKTLASYVGLYRCRELDIVYRIELDDRSDGLVLVGGPYESPMTPVFRDGFRWEFGTLVFERDAEGRPRAFELAAGRARRFRFERL